MHLEGNTEPEDETKERKETNSPTAVTDNGHVKSVSPKLESPEKQPVKGGTLRFDIMKNGTTDTDTDNDKIYKIWNEDFVIEAGNDEIKVPSEVLSTVPQ